MEQNHNVVFEKKIPKCAEQQVLFKYGLFKPAVLQEPETKRQGEWERK